MISVVLAAAPLLVILIWLAVLAVSGNSKSTSTLFELANPTPPAPPSPEEIYERDLNNRIEQAAIDAGVLEINKDYLEQRPTGHPITPPRFKITEYKGGTAQVVYSRTWPIGIYEAIERSKEC